MEKLIANTLPGKKMSQMMPFKICTKARKPDGRKAINTQIRIKLICRLYVYACTSSLTEMYSFTLCTVLMFAKCINSSSSPKLHNHLFKNHFIVRESYTTDRKKKQDETRQLQGPTSVEKHNAT